MGDVYFKRIHELSISLTFILADFYAHENISAGSFILGASNLMEAKAWQGLKSSSNSFYFQRICKKKKKKNLVELY